jgi:uncharacterized SAM-binding protein YcdF (DUF218 family)
MKRSLLLLLVVVIAFGFFAGRLLVVNAPEKADAIVVLAGGSDDNRYFRGLELLRAGYAPRMYLDALTDTQKFGHRETEYAQKFIEESAGPDVPRVKACGIVGDSTVAETAAVARCLQADGAHRVLLVTSEYHTRRALSIFRKSLPDCEISVAAAPDVRFGVKWWQHREWAKVTLEEWEKLLFWQLIERWHAPQH